MCFSIRSAPVTIKSKRGSPMKDPRTARDSFCNRPRVDKHLFVWQTRTWCWATPLIRGAFDQFVAQCCREFARAMLARPTQTSLVISLAFGNVWDLSKCAPNLTSRASRTSGSLESFALTLYRRPSMWVDVCRTARRYGPGAQSRSVRQRARGCISGTWLGN